MQSSAEVAKYYVSAGAAKAALPFYKKIILSISAGIFIALAGVGATMGGLSVSAPSVAKLISACIFPTGLAATLLTGSELFTGNMLIIISANEKAVKVSEMLKTWAVIYAGNFIGAVLIAAAVVYGNTFSALGNALAGAAINIAAAKTGLSFSAALISGILCNILVCAAVWIACAAETVSGKIIGLYFPVMLFVLCGFEHSVANMYYISSALFALNVPDYAAAATAGVSGLTWSAFFLKNLLPVTIGNIIGGSFIIGAAQWAVHLRLPKTGRK